MHLAALVVSAAQGLAWLIAAAWLFKTIEAVRGFPTVTCLFASEYDTKSAGTPTLTVIVPARNEAGAVGECLQSLVDQDYAALHVVAVNDRSTDRTGEIMDTLAARYPERVSVLHIAELPHGWLGKTHAMAVAARALPTDYVLFTDADILFAPEILRRALAYAVAERADHLVTMPTTIVKTRGEGVLLSFLQVLGLFAVRPWQVANPRAKRDAIGIGAFNLLRTEVYHRLGGFDAIPMEILEDLTLGRRVKAAGLRQRVATAPGAVSVHWASGMRGLVRGMTKNLFAVFGYRTFLLLLATAWLAIFTLGPINMVALPATRPIALIPALIAYASAAALYVVSSRVSRISAWNALAMPVAAGLLVYSLLRSMAATLKNGGVSWRGTFYPLADLRKNSSL